jgi:4-amino-4-deoxychorismate lyase
MSTVNCFVDGEPGASISSFDRGLSYGHGLFESMRLWQGKLPLLDRHLNRLALGAKILAIEFDRNNFKHELQNMVAAFPADGLVKIILTAADATRGYRYARKVSPRCIVQYFAARNDTRLDILQICDYRLPDNPPLAGIKHLNRLDQVMAAAELAPQRDGLLLDQSDKVIESLSGNLFVLFRGHWLTPSLFKAGVAGVMRGLLRDDIFPALAIPLTTGDIDLATLRDADELFISNAVMGIQPIYEVAGLRQWPEAPITAAIQAELIDQYPCFIAP